MPLLYLSTIVGISCLYFSYIGTPRLGIIPVGSICLLIGSDIWSSREHHVINMRISRHTITLAWLMIMMGLLGVGVAAGVSASIMSLWLIAINIVGRFSSYLVLYNDGKQFFHTGYYSGLLLLIMTVVPYEHGLRMTIILFTLSYMLTMALYGFLCYVIGIFKPVESWNYYMGLFFLNISIVSLIYRANQDALYLGVFLSLGYVTMVYSGIYRVLQQGDKPMVYRRVSVEDILAGARLTSFNSKQLQHKADWINALYRFLGDMPLLVKHLLSALNVILIVVLMILFVIDSSNTVVSWVNHLIYRGAIILFVCNVVLLKIVDYAYWIQRISIFFVLHFSLYVSAWGLGGGDLTTIALCAVLWNIANSMLIQYIPGWSRMYLGRQIFAAPDYRYRLTSNIVMLAINIVIIASLPLNGQILFSLAFLYLGLQIFLMIYNINSITKNSNPNL